jgi:hypothetical protein
MDGISTRFQIGPKVLSPDIPKYYPISYLLWELSFWQEVLPYFGVVFPISVLLNGAKLVYLDEPSTHVLTGWRI